MNRVSEKWSTSIHVVGRAKGEKRKKREQKIFEEIIAEYFSN